MRATEHSVHYNGHEVNFDRLNEEYKKNWILNLI